MNPMSTETQPSEHAMRAASILDGNLYISDRARLANQRVMASAIDQHAIAPAVNENYQKLTKRYQESLGRAHASIAERDRRIAELLGALDKAVELCHAPERNQDGEWWEALGLVSAILAKHGGS